MFLLSAFFKAADSLPPHPLAGQRHIMAPVLFRLMYCTGLRPYEARSLPVDRFELSCGIVSVKDSKGRDRVVPIKADVADMCREYNDRMEAILPGRLSFFPNRDGSSCWSWYSMSRSFRLCWESADLNESSDGKPVPYSFRHTFATNCIRRWKEEGKDVHSNITLLQVYMGHERVEQTLYYVHMMPGGPGDPAPYSTWEPVNRMRKEQVNGQV